MAVLSKALPAVGAFIGPLARVAALVPVQVGDPAVRSFIGSLSCVGLAVQG